MNKQRCQWRQRWWVGMLSTVMLAGTAHAADSHARDHDASHVLPDGREVVEGHVLAGGDSGAAWSGNRVYYHLDPSIKSEIQASLYWAMAHITEKTRVRFFNDPQQKHYLKIMSRTPDSVAGSCGVTFNGRQRLALQPQPLEVACTDKRAVLHLLMLSLGVKHRALSMSPAESTGEELTAGEIDVINALYPDPDRLTPSYQLKNKKSGLCLVPGPLEKKQFRHIDDCSGRTASYDYWPVDLQPCDASEKRQQWHYLADGSLKNRADTALCVGSHNPAAGGQQDRDLIVVSCRSRQLVHLTKRSDLEWLWGAFSGSTRSVPRASPASPFDGVKGEAGKGSTVTGSAAGTWTPAVRIPGLTRRAVATTSPTLTLSTVDRTPAGRGHAVAGTPASTGARVGWVAVTSSTERVVQKDPVPAAARQLVSAVNGQCLTVLASRFGLKPLTMQSCRSEDTHQKWRQASDGKIRSEAYPDGCLGRVDPRKAGAAGLVSCQGPSVASWRYTAGRLQDVTTPVAWLSNIDGFLWIDEVFTLNPAWSQWTWQ